MSTTSAHPPNPAPLLEAALALAIQLLIARHPDLLLPDDVPRIRPPPSLYAARAIVDLANSLFVALDYYRLVAEPVAATDRPIAADSTIPPTARDDFPF